MRKPKPCPFCGSVQAALYEYCVYSQVRCLACGARGPEERGSSEAAIDTWDAVPRPEKKP